MFRAEQGLTALFLRLAGRLELNTIFVMDNRRILTGLVCPVRFGGFCRARGQGKRPAKGALEGANRAFGQG